MAVYSNLLYHFHTFHFVSVEKYRVCVNFRNFMEIHRAKRSEFFRKGRAWKTCIKSQEIRNLWENRNSRRLNRVHRSKGTNIISSVKGAAVDLGRASGRETWALAFQVEKFLVNLFSTEVTRFSTATAYTATHSVRGRARTHTEGSFETVAGISGAQSSLETTNGVTLQRGHYLLNWI